ncbi:periplasmic heavy metal sensor [uncultured Maricaulis sp.]|uniref:periplasmic heavy metal sensor n=1 Tax=uncultured Maricaulis sp. TaxID=174710 RepID=UPI0030D77342|tara:strand:+ start:23502 stop:23933 length:432 start_codon:yes stop_codon:yes gene_type:complete
MLRTGLVATVLGLLGGFLGVWLGLTFLAGGPAVETNFHDLVHEDLVLTQHQEAAIAMLEREFATQRANDEARMSSARHVLAETLLRDQALSADVTRAAADIHQAMGDLQLETLSHILAMRAELDPDQRVEFDRHLARALDAAD